MISGGCLENRWDVIYMRSTAEIQRAMLLKKRLLVDPEMFRLEFLKSKHWAAVPVESASHFDSQDASRLSSAMRSLGAVSCLAVITDELFQRRFSSRLT